MKLWNTRVKGVEQHAELTLPPYHFWGLLVTIFIVTDGANPFDTVNKFSMLNILIVIFLLKSFFYIHKKRNRNWRT